MGAVFPGIDAASPSEVTSYSASRVIGALVSFEVVGALSSEVAGDSLPGAEASSPSAGALTTAGALSPGAEASSSGCGAKSPGVAPEFSPGVTCGVWTGVPPPTSTGSASEAQYNVAASTASGPTTKDTFEVAYDELAAAPLLCLTEREPQENPPDPEKLPYKCVNLADTDRDSVRVSEEEKRVTNHRDPRYASI